MNKYEKMCTIAQRDQGEGENINVCSLDRVKEYMHCTPYIPPQVLECMSTFSLVGTYAHAVPTATCGKSADYRNCASGMVDLRSNHEFSVSFIFLSFDM